MLNFQTYGNKSGADEPLIPILESSVFHNGMYEVLNFGNEFSPNQVINFDSEYLSKVLEFPAITSL